METNVRYTIAGTFVLIMLMLTIFSVIWLSAGFDNEEYSYYTVYMKESVTGLSKEGLVEFNGVEVGKIDKVILDRKNPQIVQLLIKVRSDTPVTLGTRAKLSIRALSGVAYLLLEDLGKNKKPLVAKNGVPPVIETAPSILVRLDTTLTQMNTSFRQVSSAVQSLLSKENLMAIKLLLKKLAG